MNEATRKRQLVAAIQALSDGHARRLEDKYAVGMLDLVFKLPGRPMMLAEGKIVHHQSFGPTDAQFKEGLKWEKVGVTVLLIGWKGRQMAVSPWTWLAKWDTCYIGPNKYTTIEEFLDEPRRSIEGQDEQPRRIRKHRGVGASDENVVAPREKLGRIAE